MSASFFAVAIPAIIGLIGLPSAFLAFKERHYITAAVGAVGGAGCLVILGLLAAALYNVTFGECANAPKIVPFHQGMTLCPGQTAVIRR